MSMKIQEFPAVSYSYYFDIKSFSGGRSQSTRREPPTMGKQLVNLSLAAVSRVHPLL
jgi:hypothetical protein